MKKAAIMYICTGAYIEYWKEFYDSFEQNFLSDYEKHYYLFTDKKKLYQEENSKVHVYYQEHLPWPLITLMKYHIALTIKEQLVNYDFVYWSNANIKCESKINAKDILPDKKKGQRFTFTLHANNFVDKRYIHKFNFEYERNRRSLAYIPYNIGRYYIYGNMWGGSGKDVVELMENFDNRINEDLKKRIIPIWHDESYVNHYVVTHSDYRLLDPGYCYPVGFEIDFEKKIVGVAKLSVFDVNSFKGYYSPPQKSLPQRCIIKFWGAFESRILPIVYFCRDKLLRRKPAE